MPTHGRCGDTLLFRAGHEHLYPLIQPLTRFDSIRGDPDVPSEHDLGRGGEW